MDGATAVGGCSVDDGSGGDVVRRLKEGSAAGPGGPAPAPSPADDPRPPSSRRHPALGRVPRPAPMGPRRSRPGHRPRSARRLGRAAPLRRAELDWRAACTAGCAAERDEPDRCSSPRGATADAPCGSAAAGLVAEQRGLRPISVGQVDALVEHPLDDLQRQEVVALLAQDPAQPVDVRLEELAVARGGPLRRDQPLALQEPDLGDRDVGEVLLHQRQDLADRQVISGSGLVHAAPPSVPMTNTSRNLPTWTCAPSRSSAASIRSPSR